MSYFPKKCQISNKSYKDEILLAETFFLYTLISFFFLKHISERMWIKVQKVADISTCCNNPQDIFGDSLEI